MSVLVVISSHREGGIVLGWSPGVPCPQGEPSCLTPGTVCSPRRLLVLRPGSHREDWASEVGELEMLSGAPHSLWLTMLSCLLGSTPAPLQSALRRCSGGL